ncbi:MAG: hypothetical protein ACRBCL_11580 [Maritimibacter sp.]
MSWLRALRRVLAGAKFQRAFERNEKAARELDAAVREVLDA